MVDPDNQVLGIVSEGDLIRRPELGVKSHRPRWLSFLLGDREISTEYVKTHGMHAAEMMTRPVVTVSEDTSLGEIAQLLEKRHIKRVPVVREGKLVGIITRVDLLRGLADYWDTLTTAPSMDDRAIREQILKTLGEEGIPDSYVNIVVADGVVHLWGLVKSEQERQALHIAAENTPGVKAVEDHLGRLRPGTLAD
ncbi:MAG: CBS domain-containing protein [Pseudomonadota bacterium]|nr:CBS domain-containing protein [Pseudomonadota bacterium]